LAARMTQWGIRKRDAAIVAFVRLDVSPCAGGGLGLMPGREPGG
jgi:hypothetical protein